MPAPARKTPSRKTATKAATAARREAKASTEKTPTLHVPFRGETFDVTLDRFALQKVFFRQQALAQFQRAEDMCGVLFDILGPVDSARWINCAKPGDDLFENADEFMKAMNKAGNDPNS